MDVSYEVIEARFIVQGESEVFVTLYHLYCFTVDEGGIVDGVVDYSVLGAMMNSLVFATFSSRWLSRHHYEKWEMESW